MSYKSSSPPTHLYDHTPLSEAYRVALAINPRTAPTISCRVAEELVYRKWIWRFGIIQCLVFNKKEQLRDVGFQQTPFVSGATFGPDRFAVANLCTQVYG